MMGVMKRPAKYHRPIEAELIREQTLDAVCLAIYDGANTPLWLAVEFDISINEAEQLVERLISVDLVKWYTCYFEWDKGEYLALSPKFGDTLFRQVFNPDGGVRLRYAK